MNPSPPNIQSLSSFSTSGGVSARGPPVGGRQITRNRASYSCHTCRRRKVKCDKVHPICGNCLKTGAGCAYDTSSQTREESYDVSDKHSHGVKRRRETPRTLEEDVDELQSIYGHLNQADASPGQKSDARAIETRLDKLMTMIERLGGTSQAVEAAQKHAAASGIGMESALVDDLRQANAREVKAESPRKSSPHRVSAEQSGDEFPIPAGQAHELVDPIGSLNLGHLSLEDGGRSRYVGTTYWAYISHEINDLNQLLRDQNRSHDPSSGEPVNNDTNDSLSNDRKPWRGSIDSSPHSTPRSRGSFQQSLIFPTGDSPSLGEKLVEAEMLEHVPTRRQSHILYRGFMSGIHAISPVIHPPTTLKQYNAFWEWYDYSSYSGEPCPNPSFIPLLYAIWYGGSVTISIRTIKAEFHAPSRSALSPIYNEEVNRWLTRISFPRSPSLQGLSAYLIVQTILSKEEEPLTSSLFVSLAMRVAQTMGLHRDPAKFGIEPCEAEYRRRLWWHILHMDGVVAMSSGLPPLVGDENYWDVREIGEMKDTLLGTPAAEKYEQQLAADQRRPDNPDDPSVCGGPSMVNVFYLTARGKYIMARAVRRILKIQLGIKPVTRQDMEELRTILLELQSKLNSIVDRIPTGNADDQTSDSKGRALSMSKSPVEARSSDTELPGEGPNGCSEQYHTPVLVSFHKWARIILGLYCDKAFCVAYQPFLKNARSRVWPAARQRALRHCHGFMEKFIQLATDPDFQPFHWSWPGNHQPMHATMIMLIDLYERPYSPEAYKSRAFIDRILALSGPDGGVVGGEDGVSTLRPLKDGGREAWDMIRRLRQKAWQKAGLDPEMLWTEKDQIEAGIASPGGEFHSFHSWRGSLYTGSPSASGSPGTSASTRQSTAPDRQVNDFNRRFYNMTRTHILPNPSSSAAATAAATPRPSLLRYSQTSSFGQPPKFHSTSQYNNTPAAVAAPAPGPFATPSMAASSPDIESSSGSASSTHAVTAQPSNHPPPNHTVTTPHMPFMDPLSPNPPPMGVPTPPSMVDPNLNFDWDQWDAVFGQHLPVADELMELDPVSGLEFVNFGVPAGNGLGPNGMVGSGNPLGDPTLPSSWTGTRDSHDRTHSNDWTGFSGS